MDESEIVDQVLHRLAQVHMNEEDMDVVDLDEESLLIRELMLRENFIWR